MDIRKIIVDCVKNTGKYDLVGEDTPLRGDESPLDSLAFVKFMVDVNVALTCALKKPVDVFKPEYFLGKKDNPYNTVGSLARLVNTLVAIDVVESVLVPAQEKPFKIIFTDLDGTLWDGIAGETPIKPRKELLSELVRLNDSGVLLVSISKNYEDIVTKEIKIFDDEKRFVVSIWNCIDKAAAIRDTCKRLNIGLDSAVFLDDSEHERDYVRSVLPDVWTPENHMIIEKIDIGHVTDEDRRRTEMYRQEFERENSKPRSDNTDEYMAWLRSLDMVMTVRYATTESERMRSIELIDRTNQFNCGKKLPGRSWCRTYVFLLKDKFGDMGIISTVNVDLKSDAHNFCVSCRALGRGVENTILQYLHDSGISVKPPVDSGKNKAAMDFFATYDSNKCYPIRIEENL